MAKKKSHKLSTMKLYTQDDLSDWIFVEYTDAVESIDFTMHVNDHFVGISSRGRPWECLLVKGIEHEVREKTVVFPHPVLHAYVIGSTMMIVISKPKRARQMIRCVRYRHNFTRTLRKFDRLSKEKFLKLFGERGVEIKLRPPRVSQKSLPGRPASKGTRVPRAPSVLHGAYRRAHDAGLIPAIFG